MDNNNYFCHAYTTNYDEGWSSSSEITINFLVKLLHNKGRRYMVFEQQFDSLIQSLLVKGYIDMHSYHHKGLTVRGYFWIAPLGRDYLTFSKL